MGKNVLYIFEIWPGCPNGTFQPLTIDSWTLYYDWIDNLALYGPLFSLIFGLAGNILTMFVLTRWTKQAASSRTFLMTLCASDTVYIVTNSSLLLVQYFALVDLRNENEFLCKALPFIKKTSEDWSNWILVFLTFERVLLVVIPHRARTVSTRRSSTIVLIASGSIIALYSSHPLYGMTIRDFVKGSTDITKVDALCRDINPEYVAFLENVETYISNIVMIFVPSILLMIGNTIIIFKVRKSSQKRSEMAPSTPRQDKTKTITRLLIMLSAVFVISKLPLALVGLYKRIFIYPLTRSLPCSEQQMKQDIAVRQLLFDAIAKAMYFATPTFNFLMYVMSGSVVRAELKRIFCCLQRNSPSDRTKTVNTSIKSKSLEKDAT